MWMMGYNDGGDPFSSRKLRTIVPRPAAVINPACLGRIHGAADLLSFNQHLAVMNEQNKRDFSPQQVGVSSRWNPTPEQLQTLEELYRRGTRTPSAEEIQHITAQLRRYGKIEGKNVFYWFQNHKARERQKRRRQLESSGATTTTIAACDPDPASAHNNNVISDFENADRKEQDSSAAGANGTGLEVERTKYWPSSTNCSTLAEKTASSIQRTANKAAAITSECRSSRGGPGGAAAADHGWLHFDEAAAAEFQKRKSQLDHHDDPNAATWQMMLPQFPPPHPPPCCCSSSPSPTVTTIPSNSSRTMLLDPKQNPPDIFTNPYGDADFCNHLIGANVGHSTTAIHETLHQSDQTLQLFPLRSTDMDEAGDEGVAEKGSEGSVEAMGRNTIFISTSAPYMFFEFIPLKN